MIVSDIHKNRTGKYWKLERKYNNTNRPYLGKNAYSIDGHSIR